MTTTVRTLAALGRVRVALVLAPALGLGCWGSSLSDHLGFASSLVAGLFGSVFAALIGAGLACELRRREAKVEGASVALAASGAGVALVALVLGAVLVHALVAPACSPATGAVYALLIALPGPVLAGLLGALVGAVFARRGVATGLAALLVPGFVVWSLLRFYRSPAVFSYDPFYGFYPGALYDERVPLGMTHLTHRLGTLGWITAAAALLVGGWTEGGRLSLRAFVKRTGAVVLAGIGLAVGMGVYAAGSTLGHRHDATQVAEALGATMREGRCVLRFDRSIDLRQARRTVRDCGLRIAQLEEFYGVRLSGTVTVFLFANAGQKASLMGAADTYIAKPWRREVYLQYAPFPHPVLKHELAHVVAGAMAPGPFHVTSGEWGVPLPGLIEGAAVAAAWEGEGDTTPHQWSRAMLEAGMAPRVSTLQGLGFFASAGVTAYTAAGSFCRWLHQRYGAERFRALYATGDFARVYGMPLGILEREWHAYLRTVETPATVLLRARTRFRRASIFGRRCPLLIDDLRGEAAARVASGELTEAAQRLGTMVDLDPTDLRTRLALAGLRVRQGEMRAATHEATEAGRALGPAAERRTRLTIADAAWRWLSPETARALYTRVDANALDDDEARTLVVKQRAIAMGPPWSDAVRDLLIGEGEMDASPVSAVARLGGQAAGGDVLARYLVARQLFVHERLEESLRVLPEAVVSELGDARIAAEARRMIATARYLRGDRRGARAMFVTLAEDATRPMGNRDLARDWVDRIDREGTPRARGVAGR